MTAVSTNRSEPLLLHGHDQRPAARRLLLVSYHFPPSQEVGALRWGKFAKFAIERDWALDVITLDPIGRTALDRGSLEELPAGVRVYGVPERVLPLDRLGQHVLALRRRVRAEGDAGAAATPTTHRPESLTQKELGSPFRSARDALRAFHAWRDYARSGSWSRRAETAAHRLLGGVRYQAVVSCGPPHMVHAAGRRIARARHVPFIMDLRDLWSLVSRVPETVASSVWRFLARHYERQAVRDAALIITNTDPSRLTMQTHYPGASERIIAIWNGYDEEPEAASQHGSCFVIAYAGSIYLDRDPRPLFRAAARVIRECRLAPDQLRLEFMGEIAGYGGTALATIASEEGVGEFVRVHAAGTRAEAMAFMARAAMLVSLPLDRDADTAFPAKIFEYARFDAWLLALAEHGGATELVLGGTGADVIPPRDVDAIAAVLRTRYLAYASGARPQRPHLTDTFSRRSQAHRLFDEIERCLRARQDSPA